MATSTSESTAVDEPRPADDGDKSVLTHEPPSLLQTITLGAKLHGLRAVVGALSWYGGWRDWFYPPENVPNLVKAYDCRPHCPIRVFFPASYDQSSTQILPTIFTIHGGGFAIGDARADDDWNRHVADSLGVLVVALNYSKAPWNPFPSAIHDIEAVVLAVLDDESLPIARVARAEYDQGDAAADKSVQGSKQARSKGGRVASKGAGTPSHSRTAILGFSSGGNLAMAASQLPSLHTHPDGPRAAILCYGPLDFTLNAETKMANRPFKPSLPSPRNNATDFLRGIAPAFNWGYLPHGQNLRDPLLSPGFARAEDLPPFIGVINAELDFLAFEGWQFTCRLAKDAGARVARDMALPDRESGDVLLRLCGQEKPSGAKGALKLDDKRFAFEETWKDSAGERRGVKWLLVPDVLHSFDNRYVQEMWKSEESASDAQEKTRAYTEELGRWLKREVWELET